MTRLADAVLPMIRTKADLHRWNAANSHGVDMHDAIDILEAALATTDPAEAYNVAHRALASSIKVIARADDSSGIIGDACRRLLKLHPRLAANAQVSPSSLIRWMLAFQFDEEVDYFELDPVAYAPALGERGLRTYRDRLDAIRASLPAKNPKDWRDRDLGKHWVLEWNDRRFAVLDRDVEAIIRAHARDRKVAAWYVDTAKALVEIGEFDLAMDWARDGVTVGPMHQSMNAAKYWCALLVTHRPDQVLAARVTVFDRWPSDGTATAIYQAAGNQWPSYEPDVMARLEARPADAVDFALSTLGDPQRAWDLAHRLGLVRDDVWDRLLRAYEQIDPIATLPMHRELVEAKLATTGAQYYRVAAKRLAHMRVLALASRGGQVGGGQVDGGQVDGEDQEDQPTQAAQLDAFIAELRLVNKRRPRLQQEFDRAGLP